MIAQSVAELIKESEALLDTLPQEAVTSPTMEATQGQILSQSPTDATYSR